MEYKVQPKDNFYSVGRMFNVTPKTIATYNKLDMSKGLVANKIIRIPVDDTAIAAVDNKTKTVYYIVSKGDNLTKVSRKCHTPEKNLMEWNHLQGDKILLDQKMVVGFLKYKIPSSQDQSQSLARKDSDSLAVTETKVSNTVKEEASTDTISKEAIQKQTPVKIKTKTEPQKIKEKTENVTESMPVIQSPDGGYFTSYYKKQIITQPISANTTVTAGIFKTTSGWQIEQMYIVATNT